MSGRAPRWEVVIQVILEAILGLIGALIAVWALIVALVVLFMITRRNNPYLTDHSVWLTADALVDETPTQRVETSWKSFRRAAVTRRYLLLYLSPNSCQIVPRRAFGQETQWLSFVASCEEGIREGKLAAPGQEAG
jgi:hypothetical protein